MSTSFCLISNQFWACCRREISQLQNNKIELKKAAVKGGEAHEQKARKKLEEEISKLSANLKEKHAQELSSLGYELEMNLRKTILIILRKPWLQFL